MEDLIGVALRISIAYVYVLALLRLSGKRSLGNLSPFDFLVALIVGDMFDDLFWGDVPLSMALVGFTTVIALHTATAYLAYRVKPVARAVESRPVRLVRGGEPQKEGMSRERVGEAELLSQLRLQGLEGPEKVREAFQEPSGQLSVLRKEEFEPVTKKDLPRLREVA